MPVLEGKFFNSKIDLNLPETPRIGEFTREELFSQLLDVYNAMRVLQSASQDISDTVDIIAAIKPTVPLPKRYIDL